MRLTYRPSDHYSAKSTAHRRKSANKGYDLYGVHRISQKRLQTLARQIAEREKVVLYSVKQCRFLTTGQVQRLHFTDSPTKSACIRATNRMLSRLRDNGLLLCLPRRRGGIRAGSSAAIWKLTAAGHKFLSLNATGVCSRHRNYKITTAFLEHTLAIAELFVRLKTDKDIICKTVQFEPDCWREKLKPDLYAVTISGEYEDHWFFEIDRDTEAPVRIIEKCRRYAEHYRSGAEQKSSGVFPLVVWLVPDEKRKTALERHITNEMGGFSQLFNVKVFDERFSFTA